MILDHNEMIAYENMSQTVETLTKMTRDPSTFTVDQFADISRSVLDLIAALNNKLDSEQREVRPRPLHPRPQGLRPRHRQRRPRAVAAGSG